MSQNLNTGAPLRKVGIAGLGLIGGSLGLALRARGLEVVGWDRPAALDAARRRGAISFAAGGLEEICQADLTVLAVPVGAILELLPQLAALAPAGACITDTGSTKQAICAQAARLNLAFAGGHPLAGSEHSGIQAARADLFAHAPWIFCAPAPPSDSGDLRDACAALAAAVGAQALWMEPARHDHLLALLSHAPQIISTALASFLAREFADDPEALRWIGPGLRSMLRLAGSSYSLWRDIALTNQDAIARALAGFEQEVEHLRGQLTTRELERAFADAQKIYRESRHE